MPLRKLDHVLVLTDDIERTRDFYRDALGLEVGERPPAAEKKPPPPPAPPTRRGGGGAPPPPPPGAGGGPAPAAGVPRVLALRRRSALCPRRRPRGLRGALRDHRDPPLASGPGH